MTETMTSLQKLACEYGAHNYHPLPVVAAEAEGAWVTDVDGRRYLDMLAAYSALNFGHRHPRLIAAARRQLDHLTLVSRAFEHDQFGPFCAELAELADMDVVLPMNTGAEAVETAIKVARKWGYTVKGVPADQAVIIVFGGNFHGRTTTIVSFSTDADARADFGPFTPGFRVVPYGDLDALAAAVGELGDARGRGAGRADPGRGRGDRAAGRLPARHPGAVHRARHLDDRGRDPVRARPHRLHVRLRAPRASCRTPTCSARRSAAASCRSRRWCRRGRCSACCTRASTGPPSAATRWPAPSPGRSSRCCARASTRPGRGRWGTDARAAGRTPA